MIIIGSTNDENLIANGALEMRNLNEFHPLIDASSLNRIRYPFAITCFFKILNSFAF